MSGLVNARNVLTKELAVWAGQAPGYVFIVTARGFGRSERSALPNDLAVQQAWSRVLARTMSLTTADYPVSTPSWWDSSTPGTDLRFGFSRTFDDPTLAGHDYLMMWV